MRTMLLDWISEVCEEFRQKRETLHLATFYIDKFLSKTQNYPLGKLQLIGAAALLVASKMEEILTPRLRDLVFATNSGFTSE